jgi:hypothetical protein
MDTPSYFCCLVINNKGDQYFASSDEPVRNIRSRILILPMDFFGETALKNVHHKSALELPWVADEVSGF